MTQEMWTPPVTPEEKVIEFVRDRIQRLKSGIDAKISALGKALDPAANPGLSGDEEIPQETASKRQ